MPDLVAITEADAYMRSHGAEHAADGSLIVAARRGVPVGYAAMGTVDGLAHLCEIDVLPAEAGKGVGRKLMKACEAWARAKQLPAITLSTFIDVPWNGPWYARLGFERYAPEAWPPGHRAIWQGQVESALDTTKRQMMILRL